MKKRLVTTTLAAAIAFGTFGTFGYPLNNHTEVQAAEVTNPYNNQQAVNTKADQLIQTAKSLIGQATYSNTEYKSTYPYKFSCATFLMYIFEKNGVDLATYNENYMMEQGYYVPKDQLQKGDLVFFDANKNDSEPADHVAMYIGDNKVIHMADPKQNIVISDMASKPYYTESYVTARRVLPSLLPANPPTKGDNIVDLAYKLKNQVTMSTVNDAKAKKFTGPGFVNYVFEQNGASLGTANIKEQMKLGQTVSKANLKKGDLVFFNSSIGSGTPTMVAIYTGDHRIMIPSSSGITTRVLFVDYYKDHFITAKRVLTDVKSPAVNEPAPAPEPGKTPAPSPEVATKADKIINLGKSLIGKAQYGYTYNEKTTTFTGAGFTYYLFKQNGIDLKYKLANEQAKIGKAVQKANLQKGDLIFFSLDNKGTTIKHVGIYMGNNQVLHLSIQNGVVVQRLDSVWVNQNYVTARRVL